MSVQHMRAMLMCGSAIGFAVPTAWFLMDSDVSFIPVFLIVLSGMSIVVLTGARLRLRAARGVARPAFLVICLSAIPSSSGGGSVSAGLGFGGPQLALLL